MKENREDNKIMHGYDHQKIEQKWQKKWEEDGLYETKDASRKPKSYVLDMFPYPSGEGLHVGHPKGYIATDVYSRFKRMNGYEVLHPMGWDAFGLPAENFAIKHKVHPRIAVEKNIERFKEQLQRIGLDYDWSREINTTDPEYYKWTQWIFLQMFKKGLAYESHAPINWCPSCQTGLANEDLEDGKCERCGSEVEQRPMRQWVLKITDYADRLLGDLGLLEKWSSHIKEMQRNWIGRSEGANFNFKLKLTNNSQLPTLDVKVFTTRPDTLYGVTFIVLAPEHSFVNEQIRNPKSQIRNKEEILEYIEKTRKKSELERQEAKEKTGVQIEGVSAIHPATGEEIPVFVADYVLGSYGEGAVMGVPAHDERDFEFASKYQFQIKQVIVPVYGEKEEGSAKRDGAYALIQRKSDGRVLLQYANVCDPETHEVTHKEYRLPGGGFDEGEDFEKALLREIEEETGYKFKEASLNRVCAERHFTSVFGHTKGEKFNAIKTACLLILEDSENGERKPEEYEEHYEYAWFTPEEALKIVEGNTFFADEAWMISQLLSSEVYMEEGVVISSGEFDRLSSREAGEKITEKYGEKAVTYRLQDWVFSRQRYWGEPIPIIHCEKCGTVPVPEEDLPVKLPDVESYEPTGTGESPLADIDKWVNTICPGCDGKAKRETNTMPQWAGSCWYYLRYMDPHNNEKLVDPEKEKYWSPVNVYVGGAEHATRHLIYARFWHKFLFDIGVVSTREPFEELHSVGLIMAEDGRKMSKRYGNVINPDDIIEKVGADTLRVYEMFMGPFENSIAWNVDGIAGARRFLEKVLRMKELIGDSSVGSLDSSLHKTIKKVGDDIISFKFNTAISALMEFSNKVEKEKTIEREQYQHFLQLLAPFAPHLSEELWYEVGNTSSIHLSSWPRANMTYLKKTEVQIAVQVNGKVRASISHTPDASKEEIEKQARQEGEVEKWLEGKKIEKIVVVPGRIINFVVK